MATLERAIVLAAEAHAGQIDKAGKPYILHPLRVMLAMDSEQAQIAAVLHDVVEDTTVTLADLQAAGFESAIIEAVQALTKTAGESRIEAAHRAAAHPIARVVKLADVTDNMDLGRIAQPTERDRVRLEEYRQVQAILMHSISYLK